MTSFFCKKVTKTQTGKYRHVGPNETFSLVINSGTKKESIIKQ